MEVKDIRSRGTLADSELLIEQAFLRKCPRVSQHGACGVGRETMQTR